MVTALQFNTIIKVLGLLTLHMFFFYLLNQYAVKMLFNFGARSHSSALHRVSHFC